MVQFRFRVVPLAGLEPARSLLRGILSPLRLPIPPHERIYFFKKLCTSWCRVSWRRHPDLNRGIKVLQTLALPLGYSAILACPKAFDKIKTVRMLERETRFEPATFTLARWRSTTELFPHIIRTVLIGGSYRVRTCDPLLVRQMLSQLS